MKFYEKNRNLKYLIILLGYKAIKNMNIELNKFCLLQLYLLSYILINIIYNQYHYNI